MDHGILFRSAGTRRRDRPWVVGKLGPGPDLCLELHVRALYVLRTTCKKYLVADRKNAVSKLFADQQKRKGLQLRKTLFLILFALFSCLFLLINHSCCWAEETVCPLSVRI